jgi:hypothetical protein
VTPLCTGSADIPMRASEDGERGHCTAAEPEESTPQGRGHVRVCHEVACAPCSRRRACDGRERFPAIEPDAVVREAVRALGG